MTYYICSLKNLVTYILIWGLIYLAFDCACFSGLLVGGGREAKEDVIEKLYLF